MKPSLIALALIAGAALPAPLAAQIKGCVADKNGITRCPGPSTFSTDHLGITREHRTAPQTTDKNGIVRDNTGGGYFIAPGDPTVDRGGTISNKRPPSTMRRGNQTCTTDANGITRCE
ncbi:MULTISPECIES: hypothetical protein [Roseobacteraceae]|uniref:hypothetical protein n=1 Tax=Roseobacteraceae TaxID=2854170 RepID=UPI0013BD31A2|nr:MULTISPECIES: hypothetical protein [Roseobacteraceae]MCA0994402.1 hypothetical protein [Alloyangia pacifica]NDW01015.1 hypothetical protein [Salipiger sp. PrR002]NDW59597.1 hypothetical protein [Salipiger sp. PrR004]